MTSPLVEDFNRSAQACLNPDPRNAHDSLLPETLLAKYALLMRYRAQDDAEKTALTRILYDCVFTHVDRAMAVGDRSTLYPNVVALARPLLEKLGEPANIGFVPPTAAKELSDRALAVIAKVEAMRRDDMTPITFDEYNAHKEQMNGLAALLLAHADKFSDHQAREQEKIMTSKDVQAAKPLILRPSSHKNG